MATTKKVSCEFYDVIALDNETKTEIKPSSFLAQFLNFINIISNSSHESKKIEIKSLDKSVWIKHYLKITKERAGVTLLSVRQNYIRNVYDGDTGKEINYRKKKPTEGDGEKIHALFVFSKSRNRLVCVFEKNSDAIRSGRFLEYINKKLIETCNAPFILDFILQVRKDFMKEIIQAGEIGKIELEITTSSLNDDIVSEEFKEGVKEICTIIFKRETGLSGIPLNFIKKKFKIFNENGNISRIRALRVGGKQNEFIDTENMKRISEIEVRTTDDENKEVDTKDFFEKAQELDFFE